MAVDGTAADRGDGAARTYSVGEVARLAGVTVRTLHHYDEIGLLPPSGRAANGYRTYTDVDVARLQRVLAWRELGFDLEQVADLVRTDGSTTSAAEQLREQLRLLHDRIDRLQAVAETVRKTMEAHTMGIRLTPAEMLEVFGEHDPTQYADEARERWGDSDAWTQSQRRTSSYTKDDWLRIREEGDQVVADLAAAKSAGLPPSSPEAIAAARAHGEHISRWFYDLTEEIHLGLGEMYVADDRFRRHYDDVAPGLAEYLRDAIRARYSSGPDSTPESSSA